MTQKEASAKTAMASLFFSSSRVERFVHFFELLVRNVGINLGSSNGRMAEHRLNAADIRAVD